MVDAPILTGGEEQWPPRARKDLQRYAARFPRIRRMVTVQLAVGGVLCAAPCFWMSFFVDKSARPCSAGFGIVALGLTILSLYLIRSPERSAQKFAYNVAQTFNAVCVCFGGCTLGTIVDWRLATEYRVVVGMVAVPVWIGMVYGLVWMLQTHHLSVRIRQWREQLKIKPMEGWELSPWGGFEAPIEVEEIEVDGGWDAGGKEDGAENPPKDEEAW